jgi:tRNA pseudouridine55 synthase
MVCGKGGYVRSIARDLGAALGCLGHVLWLRREWAGAFDLDDSIDLPTLERLARTPELDAHLIPLEKALCFLPELPLSPEGAVRLKNGNPGRVLSSQVPPGYPAWASFQGKLVAVGTYMGGELHPSRVFNL